MAAELQESEPISYRRAKIGTRDCEALKRYSLRLLPPAREQRSRLLIEWVANGADMEAGGRFMRTPR